jgi:hypothetical protein
MIIKYGFEPLVETFAANNPPYNRPSIPSNGIILWIVPALFISVTVGSNTMGRKWLCPTG